MKRIIKIESSFSEKGMGYNIKVAIIRQRLVETM